VLREIALSHAIQHGQHGLNGGEILSLNDLFKEFGVGLNKFGDTRADGLFGHTLMDPEGDGAEHLANHLGARSRVIINGSGFGFRRRLFHRLAVNGW